MPKTGKRSKLEKNNQQDNPEGNPQAWQYQVEYGGGG